MRIILKAKLDHEKFNAAVKDGSAGKKIKKILDETKPEAAYFTDEHGHRCAILILNMKDASQIPFFVEPWFLTFKADCQVNIAMTQEDLGKAGLDKLGKKWA